MRKSIWRNRFRQARFLNVTLLGSCGMRFSKFILLFTSITFVSCSSGTPVNLFCSGNHIYASGTVSEVERFPFQVQSSSSPKSITYNSWITIEVEISKDGQRYVGEKRDEFGNTIARVVLDRVSLKIVWWHLDPAVGRLEMRGVCEFAQKPKI